MNYRLFSTNSKKPTRFPGFLWGMILAVLQDNLEDSLAKPLQILPYLLRTGAALV